MYTDSAFLFMIVAF